MINSLVLRYRQYLLEEVKHYKWQILLLVTLSFLGMLKETGTFIQALAWSALVTSFIVAVLLFSCLHMVWPFETPGIQSKENLFARSQRWPLLLAFAWRISLAFLVAALSFALIYDF